MRFRRRTTRAFAFAAERIAQRIARKRRHRILRKGPRVGRAAVQRRYPFTDHLLRVQPDGQSKLGQRILHPHHFGVVVVGLHTLHAEAEGGGGCIEASEVLKEGGILASINAGDFSDFRRARLQRRVVSRLGSLSGFLTQS